MTEGPSGGRDSGIVDTIEALSQHVSTFIGPIDPVLHEVASDELHIDVHIAKARHADYTALVTSGMSDVAMSVPSGFEAWRFCELMICLPGTWTIPMYEVVDEHDHWAVTLLKSMARYPLANHTWFGGGHTVELSESLRLVHPQFPAVQIFPSQLLPVEALTISVGEKEVRLWSLFPIYREELEMKLGAGSDWLEQRFKENGITEVFNPDRKNVAVHPRKH